MHVSQDVMHAGMLLNRLQVQAAALWNAINQRSILLPAVFVFLWQVRSVPWTACDQLKVHLCKSTLSIFLSTSVCVSAATIAEALLDFPSGWCSEDLSREGSVIISNLKVPAGHSKCLVKLLMRCVAYTGNSNSGHGHVLLSNQRAGIHPGVSRAGAPGGIPGVSGRRVSA